MTIIPVGRRPLWRTVAGVLRLLAAVAILALSATGLAFMLIK